MILYQKINDISNVCPILGTEVNLPGSRQLYSASTASNTAMECMTCDLKTQRGDLCKYNSISMSKDGTFYVQSCLGPNIPEVVIRRTEDSKVIHILEINKQLEDKLKNKAVSDRMDLTVTMEGEN
jgi:hypothetical protein